MNAPPVADWLIPLIGDPSDLAILIAALQSSEIRVLDREDGAALSIPSAIVGTDYAPVRGFAEEHLAAVNGIGKLIDADYRSVRLSDRLLGVDVYGRVVNTVLSVEGAEIRVRLGTPIISINGVRQRDPREASASALLDGASRTRLAWDALAIVGRDLPTWSELYIAFELVQTGTGGQIAEVCGATKRELTLFGRTANSYTVLGREGRHGTTSAKPPEVPMSLGEATRLIRRLVDSWLRHLGGEAAG